MSVRNDRQREHKHPPPPSLLQTIRSAREKISAAKRGGDEEGEDVALTREELTVIADALVIMEQVTGGFRR